MQQHLFFIFFNSMFDVHFLLSFLFDQTGRFGGQRLG